MFFKKFFLIIVILIITAIIFTNFWSIGIGIIIFFVVFFIIETKKESAKSIIRVLLKEAGIEINGKNSLDIQVCNDNFYKRVLTERELGIGESYMDGWWNCESIDQFIYRVLRSRLDEKIKRKLSVLLPIALAFVFNRQSKRRAYIIGEKHYDLGNDLFQNMLDRRMNYSCAYWKDAQTLDEAQENKLELICKKLQLKPGMKVLDIGCGWGAFGKYAAEMYKVKVVGVTVSVRNYVKDYRLNLDLRIIEQFIKNLTALFLSE